MAIVKLKKLTFCGLTREKKVILEQLQILGGVHLIPVDGRKQKNSALTAQQPANVLKALEYLQSCPRKRHQIAVSNDFDFSAVVEQVLAIKTDLRSLSDERDFLQNRILQLTPWGDFKLPQQQELCNLKLWFYVIPKRQMRQLAKDLIYQVVHTNNTQCFVVVVAEQEPPANSVPVPRTHAGKVSLSDLRKQLEAVELAIEDKQAERESLTRWINLIVMNLAQLADTLALQEADKQCIETPQWFVLQVWAPKQRISEYEQFAQQHQLLLMQEEISPLDHPPTLLENPVQLAGGEEIVKFYQTPAYDDWDPSLVVFISFAAFFAMILSDAGYAGIFGLILVLQWRRMGQTASGIRLRILALVTILLSIFWGILCGGYFGYTPSEHSYAGRFKVLDINDFDSMMTLSIMVGAVHILLANLIKVWRNKTSVTRYSACGWMLLVVAGLILWQLNVRQLPQTTLQNLAYVMLGMGTLLLLWFSTDNPITSAGSVGYRLLTGIKNLTGVTRIFGDILSYMRLFALGLASASLALTFNQLAVQVYQSAPGLGLLFSLLILLLGHSLNLLLCLMSGVVHGLRLNFIEFYNWSITDEGYPFKAFSKQEGS